MMAKAAGISQCNEVVPLQEGQTGWSRQGEVAPDAFSSVLQATSNHKATAMGLANQAEGSHYVSGQPLAGKSLEQGQSYIAYAAHHLSSVTTTGVTNAALPYVEAGPAPNGPELPAEAETKNGEISADGLESGKNVPDVMTASPTIAAGEVNTVVPRSTEPKSVAVKIAATDQKSHAAKHVAPVASIGDAMATPNLPSIALTDSAGNESVPPGALGLTPPSIAAVSSSSLKGAAPTLPPLDGKIVPVPIPVDQPHAAEPSSAAGATVTSGIEGTKAANLQSNLKLAVPAVTSSALEVLGVAGAAATSAASFVPPSIAIGLSSGGVGGAAANQAGGNGATASPHVEPLQVDTSPEGLPYTTLARTPTAFEVGVSSGTHGWLKIRAELAGNGAVNASLSGATAASATALRSELPALNSYLQAEKIQIGELVVPSTVHGMSAAPQESLFALPDTTRGMGEGTGDLSGGLADGGAGGRADREGSQETGNVAPTGESEPLQEAISDPSAQRGRMELGGNGSQPFFGYGTGGGWLNVRA